MLRCSTCLPRRGHGVLCISARRDFCRYRGILGHVVQLTKYSVRRGDGSFLFVILHRRAPREHERVVNRALQEMGNVKLIVVSNVESLVCSVGSPDRSTRVVGLLVH